MQRVEAAIKAHRNAEHKHGMSNSVEDVSDWSVDFQTEDVFHRNIHPALESWSRKRLAVITTG